MSKHYPVIWATIEDAWKAQRAESKGEKPILEKNKEGYLVFVRSERPEGGGR